MQKKFDLKGAAGIDTLKFAKKVDLTNLKSNDDDLYIKKSKTVPADLIKLSNLVQK